MSDGPSPKDWEQTLARIAALEILSAQVMSAMLFSVPSGDREDFAIDLKIQFEKRLKQMQSLTFQRALLDTADRVIDSALETCKGFNGEKESPG